MFPQLRATKGPLLYCFSQAISIEHLKKGLENKYVSESTLRCDSCPHHPHDSSLSIHGNYPELTWVFFVQVPRIQIKKLKDNSVTKLRSLAPANSIEDLKF